MWKIEDLFYLVWKIEALSSLVWMIEALSYLMWKTEALSYLVWKIALGLVHPRVEDRGLVLSRHRHTIIKATLNLYGEYIMLMTGGSVSFHRVWSDYFVKYASMYWQHEPMGSN